MGRAFTIFFILIFLAHMAAANYLPMMTIVTKPLIMASLMGAYVFFVERQDKVLLVGMLAAMMGDFFLIFSGANEMFITGMIAFLIAQICYINIFTRTIEKPNGWKWVVIAFLVALSGGFLFTSYSTLGSFAIPVTVYALALSCMAITATLRAQTKSIQTPLLIGAILFVISDLLIAIHKFVFEIPLSNVLIMLTYALAQYLIIRDLTAERIAKNRKFEW
jgi:uncharacterized membrane protein YhhN